MNVEIIVETLIVVIIIALPAAIGTIDRSKRAAAVYRRMRDGFERFERFLFGKQPAS